MHKLSEKAKELLKRLKKEKKTAKQIDLVQELRDHNQEEIVNHVLLVHLQRKDHISLRLEIINALNPNFDMIVKPLSQILKDPEETLPIKEKAIGLLGENGSKNALKILLKLAKKSKEPTIKDNAIEALSFFNDSSAIKVISKSLQNDDYRLHALAGLSRNEHILLGSKDLMMKVISLEVSDNFERLHQEKIIEFLLNTFKIPTLDELKKALSENKLDKIISAIQKDQTEIDKLLKKVEL